MNGTDAEVYSADRPTLLIVDDDLTFCRVLARAMEGRGFDVTVAHDVAQAVWSAEQNPPQFAVVDLRMPGPSGLMLVKKLKDLDAEIRIVVLTGYASIATAIEAIKIGATHYLAKPARAEEIIAAFRRTLPDAGIEVAGDHLPVSGRRRVGVHPEGAGRAPRQHPRHREGAWNAQANPAEKARQAAAEGAGLGACPDAEVGDDAHRGEVANRPSDARDCWRRQNVAGDKMSPLKWLESRSNQRIDYERVANP